MYIGPWQEYRLAKIQDDAIQRIRQEWEDKIRAQLPDGDDGRLRELMQPLMAKLPGLLMAKKTADSSESGSARASRKARRQLGGQQSTRPSSASSTAFSIRRRVQSAEQAVLGNQETHEGESAPIPPAHPRKAMSRQPSTKKKKKPGASSAQATALGEVERRKKMFATWKMSQQEQSASLTQPSATPGDSITRLPQIQTGVSIARASGPRGSELITDDEPTRLPPLLHPCGDLSTLDPCEPKVPSPREEPNLDDSLDEDEVNQLLNWTDNLLSPNELDVSLSGLDEAIHIG